MPLFTKRPVTITADRWFRNGDHPDDYAKPVQGFEHGHPFTYSPQHQRLNNWEGQVVRYLRSPGEDYDEECLCLYCLEATRIHGWVDTLEGDHIVCPGDWIVTGAQGERYPVKPAIFEATYDPVDS